MVRRNEQFLGGERLNVGEAQIGVTRVHKIVKLVVDDDLAGIFDGSRRPRRCWQDGGEPASC
jgi:hypothetical protein